MAEYIEREAAYNAIVNNYDTDAQLRDLDAIPAADVRPVVHGRWIEQPLDFDLCGVVYYQCSECGKEQQTPSHYC